MDFDYDNSIYEKQAVENLKESIDEFLADDRLINQLAGVLKESIVESYTYHADKAEQIKRVHSMIFKDEEL